MSKLIAEQIMKRFDHGSETPIKEPKPKPRTGPRIRIGPGPKPKPKWLMKGQRKPGAPPKAVYTPKPIQPAAPAPPHPTQPPALPDPRPNSLEVAVELQALRHLRDRVVGRRDKHAITAQTYVLRPNYRSPSTHLSEEDIDLRFDDQTWTWNQWHAALFARAWLDGELRGLSLVDLWHSWIQRRRRKSWNTWRDQPETPCNADTPSSSHGHPG